MKELDTYELPSIGVESRQTFANNPSSTLVTTITTLPVSPGGLVCPVGLEIDPEAARGLLVLDVRVGRNSQLVSMGCLPGTLFTRETPLVLDRIRPGSTFSLSVTCPGPEVVAFSGRLLASPIHYLSVEKYWPVGFGYSQVEAGRTVDLLVRPQVRMTVRRLHVPPLLLRDFRVDALFHGPYLDAARVSSVADPERLGTLNLSQGGELELSPVAEVGIGSPVTLRVTNTSQETRFFSGALLGLPVAEDVAE